MSRETGLSSKLILWNFQVNQLKFLKLLAIISLTVDELHLSILLNVLENLANYSYFSIFHFLFHKNFLAPFINICEIENPCKNGGTCIFSNMSYYCKCAQGFMGYNCTKTIDLTEVKSEFSPFVMRKNKMRLLNDKARIFCYDRITFF